MYALIIIKGLGIPIIKYYLYGLMLIHFSLLEYNIISYVNRQSLMVLTFY